MIAALAFGVVQSMYHPQPQGVVQPIAHGHGELIRVERSQASRIPGTNRFKVNGLPGQWQFEASDGVMLVLRAWRPRIRGVTSTAAAEG